MDYHHAEYKDTGAEVPDTPQWQTYLNAHWDFYPEWSLDAQWFLVGERERTAGDPRPDIDNYSLVNLVLRRRNIAKYVDLALLVKNVFNENVREPSLVYIPNDYPMEGRSVFGEARVHF